MAYYNIKKDTKHIASVIKGSNIGPRNLYRQLKDDYPDMSFCICHTGGPTEVYFNDPNTGKSGYICMSDKGRKLGDIGISKDEYTKEMENICGPYEHQTVPVESFEGFFRNFVLSLPEYIQLSGDAYPSDIVDPLAPYHDMPDWESFDLIIEF